ncbi:hypothetical protein [Fluviispira sanaruensis]|uniref:Uncharacterized protein n=1 Tax=Fluviispira sanaruensis TaxID=2493639 RepID=A0A4P2VZ60_FLUSA|nr:hypothetical protein [Fluviispira sanaruensis]BBH54202.1 hypothetical protein JCM31447_26620 [Fluviispira sanaruensis]
MAALIGSRLYFDGKSYKLLSNNQYWPEAYRQRTKVSKENDPVIRVAALTYEKGVPNIYHSHLFRGSPYSR